MRKATGNGNLNRADSKLWTALDYAPSASEDQQLQQVMDALDDGADPNLTNREFQNFRSALGLAVSQRHPRVVSALLAAGAKPHWPSDEEDVPIEDLTGEPDTSYSGAPLDPLYIALEDLAWVLAEGDANDNPRHEHANLREIIGLLLDAGAPNRPDPATANMPLDRFFMVLVENSIDGTDWTMPAAAECFFETLHHFYPEDFRKMLAGHWRGLGACQWEWDDDMPRMTELLTGLAQKTALSGVVPAATTTRKNRL